MAPLLPVGLSDPCTVLIYSCCIAYVCALRLPCRVVYSSATGASEPSNMAYMVRMLPVGFGNTYDMIKTLQTAGLGSLELFCMGLKAMGSYLARTLSYHGANFVMDDVQLSPQFR